MIISHFPSGSPSGLAPFTYTGDYETFMDETGWKIRFLSSGLFTYSQSVIIDAFLVGGGGNGGNSDSEEETYQGVECIRTNYGAGGGGGRTLTVSNLSILPNVPYAITVGGAGISSSIADDNDLWPESSYTAIGGNNAVNETHGSVGGNGGSGGAGYAYRIERKSDGHYMGGVPSYTGGRDGGDGLGSGSHYIGIGQGTTTREFGETNGALYASGGDSKNPDTISAPEANTGDGGGSGKTGATGIVIFRNVRS